MSAFLVGTHKPAVPTTSAARMAASLRSTRSVAKAAVSNRTGRIDYRLSEAHSNGKREGEHFLCDLAHLRLPTVFPGVVVGDSLLVVPPTGWRRPLSAAALGYDSDLDFVFPFGSGVFKAGGDLAFHHGGPSLQELVIPVLTIRMKVRERDRSTAGPVTATGLPDAVTNRIFSVTFELGGKNLSLFSSKLVVRPLLISSGKQVGGAGMAVDADHATNALAEEFQRIRDHQANGMGGLPLVGDPMVVTSAKITDGMRPESQVRN